MVGEADNVLALTTIYATKAQAMRAAQPKWDKLQRGVAAFSINLAIGQADLYPETPVRVTGFKRVIDEQAWTITKVPRVLNNDGYTTAIELEVKLEDAEYDSIEIIMLHSFLIFRTNKNNPYFAGYIRIITAYSLE